MKKIFSVLLLILCMLAFASCKNEVIQKAPDWLRGKIWSGEVTMTSMGMSMMEYLSFEVDDDGSMHFEDVPKDISIVTSGNSDSFRVSMTGAVVEGGIRYIVDVTYVFTRINNNICKLSGSIRNTTQGSVTSASMSGTLYALYI